MRNYCNHINHDISKDLHFCKLLAQERYIEAKEYHHNACRKGFDTQHHDIEIEEFNYWIHNNKYTKIKELFDDQASIAGRYFKIINNLHKDKQESLFNIQKEIVQKGIILKENSIDIFIDQQELNKILSSQRLAFKVWKQCSESNFNFNRYWKQKFHENYKKWHPPIDNPNFRALD